MISVAATTRGADDRVTLGKGRYVLTREGADEDEARTGDLDVTAPLEVKAVGRGRPLLDGDRRDRIFDVFDPGTLQLTGVLLQDGKVLGNGGGAIRAEGDLTVKKSILRDNLGGGSAGAIYTGNAERSGSCGPPSPATGQAPECPAAESSRAPEGSLEIVRSKLTGTGRPQAEGCPSTPPPPRSTV